MNLVFLALIAAALFLLLDLVWFYFASDFFKGEISSIARLTTEGEWDVRLVPALLVYALMGVGVMAFVYLNATSLTMALLLGALFGLVGYGLYDLTNLATLSDWTIKFAVVDIIWGTFLCATVSGLIYYLGRLWF